MKRMWASLAAACVLACGLWLAASLSFGGGAPALAALPAPAQQGQHTLIFQEGVSPSDYESTADTFIDFYSQGKNEGGRPDFGVTFDDKKRALLRFDLSQHIPPGAQVLTATLTLRVNSRTASSAIGLVCYQVLQAWTENSATWQQARSGVDWWGPGCDSSSRSETPLFQVTVNQYRGGSIDLDLTDVVQEWVDHPEDNCGVQFQGQQVASRVTYFFGSAENSNPDYRPKLVVVYEGHPPLATPTPTLTPTKTPTPPNPTTISSTLSDWKFDLCLKTGKDPRVPPAVRTSPVESMLIMWEGTVYTAKLKIVICQTNPGAEHPIYLNGHLVGRSPPEGTTGCECNLFPIAPEHQFEFELDPSIVLQGANYITVTNAADPYEEWKASRARIVLVGDITGTTRSEFELGIDWRERRLGGAMQAPMGYDPNAPKPLLVSVPGTGEDKVDGLNRFAIEANQRGWLLASLDMRHIRWSDVYQQVARSPSLAVQQDVLDLVNYMQAHYNVDPSRIYIGGFSTGGGIATTVAAKHPDFIAGVLDYSGPADYAQWYAERPELYTKLQYEFGGGPYGNFEYPRRSSRRLARNLQYVPVRIRHSAEGDTDVPFAQSENLYQAMTQFYDPSQYHKELITHTLGHVDPDSATKVSDLDFLSQFALVESVPELQIITDEGKDYYWLSMAKADTADDNWRGWVEVKVHYDPGTSTIWMTAGDGDFAQGRPITITLDLARMGLDTVSAYDVEEYDWRTGDFAMLSVLPTDGKLILSIPPNDLGLVGRQYVIYPATGHGAHQVRLQQNLNGYTGARDTYLTTFWGDNPAVPHGDATDLLVGYDGRRKALLKFDLSPIPDGIVLKAAKMTVHRLQYRSVSISLSAYEALRSWQDSEATWDWASQGQAWSVPGAEGLGSDRANAAEYIVPTVQLAGPYSFNLKDLVERWLAVPGSNHGLVLIGEGSYTSASYPLASAEYHDTAMRPLLEIWYMEPTPVATATPTSTATPTPTATPAGCTIQGSVTLQGRPAPPDPSWSVPLTVIVGSTSSSVTTDQWGNFALSSLTSGTYDIRVKNNHTLRNVRSGVTLAAGTNTIHFGTLVEGDANDDNYVNINDFSILSTGFSPAYDARADFNEDGVVNINDFSLLAANFGMSGDITVTPQGPTGFRRLPVLLR